MTNNSKNLVNLIKAQAETQLTETDGMKHYFIADLFYTDKLTYEIAEEFDSKLHKALDMIIKSFIDILNNEISNGLLKNDPITTFEFACIELINDSKICIVNHKSGSVTITEIIDLDKV